ncbi:glycosyltransferase [Mycobacterium sp. URHB0044]|uniref:glycosyltransferase n=1 Tax=Mycobacterium sp. URHB0044 TaxID=1380386 RepID=UPI000490CFAD|nr:glycosyltransferase [Mycobacterium sp. URHB0044]
MRVCFFIPSLDGGGAQRQCIAMVNALQHMSDVEIHLILLGPGVHDDSLDLSRLQLHRTEVRNFASPFALAFVVRTLRRVRPDLLISWLHPADLLSYAATRVVRGLPWVMTERCSDYTDRPAYNVRKRVGRRAPAAIIANSEAGKKYWESLDPRPPVQMIPNMVIVDDVGSQVSVDRSDLADCLFVGRLDPEKNVGAMTSAFARLAAGRPEARLVVAGIGAHAADVVRIAEREGVASRVELLGFRKDVPRLMARARVMLSFSLHEGMPNVVMEAVGAGLPAVVSDIPEHRALLGDDYPYYVRLDSTPEEAAGVVAQAWDHGLTADEQVYAHAREILATMTPEKIARAYIDAFAAIIAGADPRNALPLARGELRRL